MLELVVEILEVELLLEDFALHLEGVFLLNLLLDLLDKAEHIAHAQNTPGHTVGIKRLDALEILPYPGEDNRHAGDVAYAYRRAATRVAVELGEYRACNADRVVEVLRDIDRVLTGHCVDDKINLGAISQPGLETADFIHHLVVDMGASRCIINNEVGGDFPGPVATFAHDEFDVLRAFHREDIEPAAFADDMQLLNGGGAVNIERD